MIKIIIILVAGIFSNLVQAQNFNLDYNPFMMIKYRKDFMTAVKGHNNGIKAIVYGAVPLDSHLDLHITSLEKMFNEIESLFPVGSDVGETSAKSAIWAKPEKFKQHITNAQQALQKFKKVVSLGDKGKSKAAFKKFGQASCGKCHKSFKRKK